MKASDYIVRFFRDHGVDVFFGYSGGAITHLTDSISRSKGALFVQTYHEQTAAIAAEGASWISAGMGVAIATSGPGATNLITGIADAYFDSIPVFYLTGEVNTYEYKGQKPIRQQGFQETDIVSIVKPITKYAAMIMDPLALKQELEKAWRIAKQDRPGPVLLDIPMDVQRADIDVVPSPAPVAISPSTVGTVKFRAGVTEASLRELVDSRTRPIMLLGNGVILSGAGKGYCALAREYSIPVVCSLLGKGAYPEDDPLFIGMIGSYGNRCANMAMANADLVLAVGARMDTRQTGTNLKNFVRDGKVIRIDIDEAELDNHRLEGVLGIVSDAKAALPLLNSLPWGESRSHQWLDYCRNLKKAYGQASEVERFVENKAPYRVMQVLSDVASQDQIFTVDIGQNQMFAAQTIIVHERQAWKTSGGMAPMGFALPAAIGAAFATRGSRPVIAIVGDGGLHISMQSLLTIHQYKLPIKIVLLNNHSLGMITQFQDLYFDGQKSGTTRASGYLTPDFEQLAHSCYLEYRHILGNSTDMRALLTDAILGPAPMLIEVDVGESTIVCPKLAVNMPIEDVDPRLPDDEFASAMWIGSIRR